MKKILFSVALASTALFSACQTGENAPAQLNNDIDSISYVMGALNSAPESFLKQHLDRNGSDSAYIKEFLTGLKEGLNAGEDKKKIAYILGTMVGFQSQQGIKQVSQQIFGGDSTQTLNYDLFLKGFNDQMAENLAIKNEKGESVSSMELQMMMRTTMEALVAKRTEITKQESAKFMEEVAKKEGVKALANGVYYKEIKAGKGECPAPEDVVEIAYEGRLANGKVFDKSEGFNSTANRFIPGFNLALQNMTPGAEWEVYIPQDQAYGEQPAGEIPAGSALIFKITLKSVEKAPVAAPVEESKQEK